MKKIIRTVSGVILATLLVMNMMWIPKVHAISNFNLKISFADDYATEQGHVEYQINGGSWAEVSAAASVNITEEVTSLKFKVVSNQYYEVNFDNGPYLADGSGVAFNAGSASAAREALTGGGYEANLTDGLTAVSLTGVTFRATSAANTADVSVSIKGAGMEYWEEDVPSRINLSISSNDSGTQGEIIRFGSSNLTWEGGNRPPNATGVSTTNPVSYTYNYDNSGKVTFWLGISNASTKITSLKINGTDYSSQCPGTNDEIYKSIEDGMATRAFKIADVPHSANYDIEIVQEVHDLMGSFGWNYLPEETQNGDAREECIAHGRLSFIRGEWNGTTYDSVSAWNRGRYNNTGEVFAWEDALKEYADEHDAWGRAAFPKGAKITMKLIPDEGYQLVSLYGDENLVPEDEVGVYTITMKGGMNSHLSARFQAIDDTVNASHSKVSEGQIANAENTFSEGTLRLDVADAVLSQTSRDAFEQKADEERIEIQEYLDISLKNVVYKATNNANNAWERDVENMSNPAQITLKLSDDYSDKENLVIIHEHGGSYETIPVTYDAGTNSITFETTSFSNYALGNRAINTITVNTPDGHGTADPGNPASANENDRGIMLLVEPENGYVYDHHTATGINEDDVNGYSMMFSGWPTVGIMINKMTGNSISFDVYFAEAITVTYDANGGIPGEMWEDSRLIKKGQKEDAPFQISDDFIIPPEGKEYDGVEINGVRYGPDDPFTFDEDVTVIFQWKDVGSEAEPCEVTFDLNGTKTKDGDSKITLTFQQGETFEVPSSEEISEMVIIPECKAYGGIRMGEKIYKPGEVIIIPNKESATMQIVWNDDHDWGDWIITKEPTATETGLKIRVCGSNPDHIQTEIIPATGGSGSSDASGGNSSPGTGSRDDIPLYGMLFSASVLILFLLYQSFNVKKRRLR